MKAIQLLWMGLALALVLSACRKEKEPAPVATLVAAAGPDRTVAVNAPVQLDGTASRDGNGRDFTYAWRLTGKPAGSQATLSGPDTAKPTFTPDVAGAYVVALTIANASGQATDAITITATAGTPGDPAAGVINADITQDRHLADVFADPARADYLVTAEVKVGARLSLAPGVVVAFQAGKGLMILPEGALTARGTADRPVVFTGKDPARGSWKGLWVYSNHPLNALDHATVAYGGGSDLPGAAGTKANLVLVSTYAGSAAMKITNSRFTEGGGYGLLVQGQSRLNGFSANVFSANAGAALFVPAGQVHQLDALSRLTGNNGLDGVQTRGTLREPGEVAWPAFTDGSAYHVTGDLTAASGLILGEGVTLRFAAGTLLEVTERGFLQATGSPVKPVTFTAAAQTPDQYWGGIVVNTRSERNRLHYAAVSYVAGKDLPGYADAKANVTVGNAGQLSLLHSTLAYGTGWGVVAYTDQGALLNADAATGNRFEHLALGSLKLFSGAETAPLAGEWLDAWSFHRGLALSETYYDRAANRWFNGAADPWTMNPQGGFGLHVAGDGSYRWTIAEHGPATGCGNAYFAEYILGKVTAGGDQLTFAESYWRSKFYLPCDESQSTDTEVTPGTMTLRYRMYREAGNNGSPHWVLQLTHPNGSSFTYYRR
ncbi:MAG: hypothetical protein ICV83_15360 [Cytophagales bacterium]|nr:hypothetical protein [Cytophagales bacterium]